MMAGGSLGMRLLGGEPGNEASWGEPGNEASTYMHYKSHTLNINLN